MFSTTESGGRTTSRTGFPPRGPPRARARPHAGPGVGCRLRGASHATPRAAEEARVVTTGDEISLNYHSVGPGSAACHAAAAGGREPALPRWRWPRPPRAPSPAEGAGGQSAPSRRALWGTVPSGGEGWGAPEENYKTQLAQLRGVESVSKRILEAHTENYL